MEKKCTQCKKEFLVDKFLGKNNALKSMLDGKLLGTYASMNIGAKENGTYHSLISKCCSNPDILFTAGGFYWCFLDQLERFQQEFVEKTS